MMGGSSGGRTRRLGCGAEMLSSRAGDIGRVVAATGSRVEVEARGADHTDTYTSDTVVEVGTVVTVRKQPTCCIYRAQKASYSYTRTHITNYCNISLYYFFKQ